MSFCFPHSRTPTAQDIISPRVPVSSGSRRRRRRKNSQSDSKKQLSGIISPIPHCVSPVEVTPKIAAQPSSKEQVAAVGNSSAEHFTPVSSGRRHYNMNSEQISSEKAEKARTRLLGRFEGDGSQESAGEVQGPSAHSVEGTNAIQTVGRRESPKKMSCAGSVVQPIPNGRVVKGGWANLPKMYVQYSDHFFEIHDIVGYVYMKVCLHWCELEDDYGQ